MLPVVGMLEGWGYLSVSEPHQFRHEPQDLAVSLLSSFGLILVCSLLVMLQFLHAETRLFVRSG